jgi:CheY-like chemotaxis protein
MKLQLSQQAAVGGETKTNLTDLGGAKILLVEDNEFNRAVATRSLKRHHCSITEANNGQEAIDILLNNNRFDVILMDLQMPVMGGIEATRIIRQQLKINTPIIALTANAFKSEIETCRTAGMNDHVTKPFEESVLVGLVARYKGLKSNTSEVQQANLPANGSDKLYSLDTLYNISQNDEKFVRDMVKLFSDQTREILHDIKTALEKNDYAQVSALAHKIKPGIDNMGIASLKQTIRQLETESKKDPQPKNINALFMEVERVLTDVLSQLEQQVLHK